MRIALQTIVCGAIAAFLTGCVVYTHPAREVIVESGPVVQGPGVEVIEVEPPPAQRVYIYEPGYPPGVYYYNNCYWYGGYRYERDVFVTRYVDVNVREHRYVDVQENRAEGRRFEQMHREEYARTGGTRAAAHPVGPEYHPNSNATYRPAPNGYPAQTNERYAPHPGQTQGQPHPQQHPQPRGQQEPPRQMGGRNIEQ